MQSRTCLLAGTYTRFRALDERPYAVRAASPKTLPEAWLPRTSEPKLPVPSFLLPTPVWPAIQPFAAHVAIISHPDAGKTTLTEKLLLFGGAIHVAGAVKARMTPARTLDWTKIEQQRGISVTTSVMHFSMAARCSIFSTAGHEDFQRTPTHPDRRRLAVMVIDAAKRIEART